MKKLLIVFLLLIIGLGGCANQPKEEPQEPFIEFTANEFYLEWGSDFDPLSEKYIKDSYGVITYEVSPEKGQTEVDTTLISSVPEHYKYKMIYTATSETDSNIRERYEISFIVKKRPPFNSDGYAYDFVSYKIEKKQFEQLETRFKLKSVIEGFPTSEEIWISLLKNKSFLIMSESTDGLSVLWKGEYAVLSPNIYHITNLKDVSSPEKSYEAYFILSSLDEEGKLYYFMEYPENGYDENMDSFDFFDFQ